MDEQQQPQPLTESTQPKNRVISQRVTISFLDFMLVMVALLGVAFGLYTRYYQKPVAETLDRQLVDVTSDTLATPDDIIRMVGRTYELPKGEVPTTATIDDPTQMQDQIFFKNALAGDVLIMYVEAKKAILFRPSTQKIIEVGPIQIKGE